MIKTCLVVLLLALSACTFPLRNPAATPCAAGEATSACQVERYQNASVP